MTNAKDSSSPLHRPVKLTKFLTLVRHLAQHPTTEAAELLSLLQLRRPHSLSPYRNLLLSANFLEPGDSQWTTTSDFSQFFRALEAGTIQGLQESLAQFPFYRRLRALVQQHPIYSPIPASSFRPSYNTLSTLGEITGLGISDPNLGFFPTPATPSPGAFRIDALTAYEELCRSLPDHTFHAPYVPAGSWLYNLATKHAIHSCITCAKLARSIELDLLNCQTKHDKRVSRLRSFPLRILTCERDELKIHHHAYYDGSFLFPDRIASLILITLGNHENDGTLYVS